MLLVDFTFYLECMTIHIYYIKRVSRQCICCVYATVQCTETEHRHLAVALAIWQHSRRHVFEMARSLVHGASILECCWISWKMCKIKFTALHLFCGVIIVITHWLNGIDSNTVFLSCSTIEIESRIVDRAETADSHLESWVQSLGTHTPKCHQTRITNSPVSRSRISARKNAIN